MPQIIVEMCQNYNGDREILKKMIHAASEAGAEYAKIQTIHSDYLTKRPEFENGRIEEGMVKVIKRPYKPEYERLKAMDIDMEDHQWFIEECHRAGIKAMTTVFTRGAVKELSQMDWDAVKVASYDCASFPLLKDLRENFNKIFISTGATYNNEIRDAAKVLNGVDYTFLHCVTIYPTPLEKLQLNRLDYLKTFTSKVGFSDHTLVARDGIKASVAALLKGASVIERHFTILDSGKTKDGPVSITPDLLIQLVYISNLEFAEMELYVKQNIPEFEQMLGDDQHDLSHEELLNRNYYRGRFATKHSDGKFVYNWEKK